jgi:hypothetical protein
VNGVYTCIVGKVHSVLSLGHLNGHGDMLFFAKLDVELCRKVDNTGHVPTVSTQFPFPQPVRTTLSVLFSKTHAGYCMVEGLSMQADTVGGAGHG